MGSRSRTIIAGRRAFVGNRDEIVAGGGFVAGQEDGPQVNLPGNPDAAVMFEDFIGVNPVMSALAGDTGHGSGLVAGTGGIYQLFTTQSGDTGLKHPAAGVAIAAALQWKGNQGKIEEGPLRFAARLKVQEISRDNNRVHVFAGFTDVATYEFPAYDTGGGLIGTADDFMGFLFSPGGDTGLSAVAGNGGTDQTIHLDTGIADNEYVVLEMEYRRGGASDSGEVQFFVDGVHKGSLSAPISDTVGLAPAIYAFQQDTGHRQVDIDWVNVSAPRDTGT